VSSLSHLRRAADARATKARSERFVRITWRQHDESESIAADLTRMLV
jgi:hypothetical protein